MTKRSCLLCRFECWRCALQAAWQRDRSQRVSSWREWACVPRSVDATCASNANQQQYRNLVKDRTSITSSCCRVTRVRSGGGAHRPRSRQVDIAVEIQERARDSACSQWSWRMRFASAIVRAEQTTGRCRSIGCLRSHDDDDHDQARVPGFWSRELLRERWLCLRASSLCPIPCILSRRTCRRDRHCREPRSLVVVIVVAVLDLTRVCVRAIWHLLACLTAVAMSAGRGCCCYTSRRLHLNARC